VTRNGAFKLARKTASELRAEAEADENGSTTFVTVRTRSRTSPRWTGTLWTRRARAVGSTSTAEVCRAATVDDQGDAAAAAAADNTAADDDNDDNDSKWPNKKRIT
jgi:hypothetical protein